MKISRNSWHYRLIEKCLAYPSNGLCGYFWQIVASIGLCLLLFVLTGIFIALLSQPVFLLFGLIEPAYYGVGIALWCCCAIAFKRIVSGEPEEGSGILEITYKMIKSTGICPIIEFK